MILDKTYVLTLMIPAALFFHGCSSGQAVDGYLSNASVCIDLNDNLTCDSNEPTTTTDTTGNYFLDMSLANGKDNARIIVYGGTDTSNNAAFDGIIKAPIYQGANGYMLTPLTTMVANLTTTNATNDVEAAMKTVATALGVSTSDFADVVRDPIALSSYDASKKMMYTYTLQLQKSLEIMVQAQIKATGETKTSAMLKVATAFANALKTASSGATSEQKMSDYIDAVAANSSLDPTAMNSVKVATKAMVTATLRFMNGVATPSKAAYAQQQTKLEGYKATIFSRIQAGTISTATFTVASDGTITIG